MPFAKTGGIILSQNKVQIKKRNMRKIREASSGYLFLLPAFTVFLTFMYYPMLKSIKMSFQTFRNNQYEWAGLANYKTLFTNGDFLNSIIITVTYALVFVLLSICIAVVISLTIEASFSKFQPIFRAAFYLPGVVPGVVMALIWRWFYDPNAGLFNYILSLFGISEQMWLGDPDLALFSLIFMQLCTNLGPFVLIILAGLTSIQRDILESARIDGAGKLAEIIFIKLPQLKPTLLYLLIVQTINAFQVFTPVYLMTNGGPNGATDTIAYLIYSTAFRSGNIGLASAQSIVLMIIISIIALVQVRVLTQKD